MLEPHPSQPSLHPAGGFCIAGIPAGPWAAECLDHAPSPPSAKSSHLKPCQNTGGADASNLFSMGFADFNSAALLSWNQRQKSRSCQVAEASDKDFILHAGCDFCLLSTDVFTCVIPSWQGSRLLRTGKSAANKTFYKGLNFF